MSDELTARPITDLSTLSREQVLAGVDDALLHLYQTGDIQGAVRVLGAFARFEDVSGVARAKFLWGSKNWWTETKQEGDFYEKFGLLDKKSGKVYSDRLINLWDCIQDARIPKQVYDRMTVRELVPIAETLGQKYDISKEQWSKIVQLDGADQIRAYLQKEVKKKEPRSHTMKFTVDGNGTITMWHQDVAYFCGSLNVQDAKDNDILAAAIERIKSGNAKMEDV
jgi:hypothetical protein